MMLLSALGACGGGHADPDAGTDTDAAATIDGSPTDAPPMSVLGTVGGVQALADCPSDAPPGSTCQQLTVTGCPGIETEAIDATIAVIEPVGTSIGTIVHFTGGGGQGFQTAGAMEYRSAGYRQVFVSWEADWEQTASLGIKTAACRPSTVLRWVFSNPTLHGSSRTAGFCGEGFSGGSAQLGYALATYGLGDILDYVNELSGPPFARLDLGCDGDAPATATVCGASVTMRLPDKVANWENIPQGLTCGSQNVPAAELDRWKNDSIAIGGVYDYPKTRVEFFNCTNNATTVTGMAQLYYDQLVLAQGGTTNTAFHCYSQMDGCQGEALGLGARDAIQAMLDGCIPRHQ